MAKPPETPAGRKGVHSDLEGVHRDQKPLNAPENADPKLARQLAREEAENIGRPKPSRS
ncbi:hypothetical protein SAMN06295912_102212 [Sphingomonas laterariae]|uniref:Uncharacterized protein n=1 Tax=Edaphosphingomonas laterariae TaxID=861865 RepID=A0A239CIL0_9SPHN|nr:hypothetical protein [Sphingomonas laterariae]SNS19531.1 hypothetical protein SAMN06295912_102212 [Sphingomonas laterariae]